MSRLRRWSVWLGGFLLLAGAVRLAVHFPWRVAADATSNANLGLLAAALAVNLLSLLAKGWAWQLLLRPVHRVAWRTTQMATLAGAAVTDVATSLVGEAARIQVLVRRTRIGWRHAVASVVYLRAVEGLGLAMFLLAAPLLVRLPAELRALQVGAAVALLVALAVLAGGLAGRLAARAPSPLRSAAGALADLVAARALPAPLVLAVVNWAAQWMTYGLVLRASGIHPARLAAFVALVATNLAGLVPLSPGNVGVFQVAMVLGLMPMGIAADRAALAGIVLQVIQIPPVLALAAMAFGTKGLGLLRATRFPESPPEHSPAPHRQSPSSDPAIPQRLAAG